MIEKLLKPVDAVIGAVATSSVATAVCTIVVVSNVYDAMHGPSANTLTRTVVERSAMPAPTAEPRQYPQAEASTALAAPVTFSDQSLAILRNPPQRGDGTVHLARLPDVSGPFDRGDVTTDGTGTIIVAGRIDTPEFSRPWQAPLARPAIPARTAPELEQEAPIEENSVLVAISPRPPSRPATARLPEPEVAPVLDSVQVARAEAPGEVLTPVRAAPPEDGGLTLFPPRSGANPCSSRLANGIPRRPGRAAPGSAIMASLGNGAGGDRDNAIIAQAMAGNVPGYLRALQPVRFQGLAGGQQTEIVICVTPDYLAVGSDADHVRVPLGLPAALRVADAFDMMLPTTRMVDAIYAQAGLRLSPRPMSPGPQMSSTDYFMRHDATLDAQFANAGGRQGLLVAGHKKDLVIANRLTANRGRVAIYGWHRSNGDPIQPLSTVHGAYYADYSHGIRLVSRTAYVNGRAIDLRSLLTNGTYAGMLNSGGPLSSATVQLASL